MRTKIKVALNLPRTAGGILVHAKHIAASTDGNPAFPSPPLPIATLIAQITELDAAQVTTLTRTRGAAADRDTKLATVVLGLNQLKTYVETVANQHAEDAEAVVVSAGMDVKQSAGPRKQVFSAKQGRSSGVVMLSALHPGVAASFDWQYSTDQEHWTDAPSTTWAHQQIRELTPGARYWFRYRTLIKDVKSDWSDPFMLLVV